MSLETELTVLREVILCLTAELRGLKQEIKDLRASPPPAPVEPPSPQTDWVAEPPAPVAPTPIKKKRGRPAKKAEAPEPPVPAPEPEAVAPELLPTIPIPTAKPAEPTFQLHYYDISNAVITLVKECSKQHAVDLLAKYGAKNARELPEAVWPQFLADASIIMQSAAG